MSTKYDHDYFIAKFSAIPDQLWFVGNYDGPDDAHCALGHCLESEEPREEETALHDLLAHVKEDKGPKYEEKMLSGSAVGKGPAIVNDALSTLYQQDTPKARILAALHDAKAKSAADAATIALL